MDLDDYEASTEGSARPHRADVGATTAELPSDVWATNLMATLEKGDQAAAPIEEPESAEEEAAWQAALTRARAAEAVMTASATATAVEVAAEVADEDAATPEEEAAWEAALARARAAEAPAAPSITAAAAAEAVEEDAPTPEEEAAWEAALARARAAEVSTMPQSAAAAVEAIENEDFVADTGPFPRGQAAEAIDELAARWTAPSAPHAIAPAAAPVALADDVGAHTIIQPIASMPRPEAPDAGSEERPRSVEVAMEFDAADADEAHAAPTTDVHAAATDEARPAEPRVEALAESAHVAAARAEAEAERAESAAAHSELVADLVASAVAPPLAEPTTAAVAHTEAAVARVAPGAAHSESAAAHSESTAAQVESAAAQVEAAVVQSAAPIESAAAQVEPLVAHAANGAPRVAPRAAAPAADLAPAVAAHAADVEPTIEPEVAASAAPAIDADAPSEAQLLAELLRAGRSVLCAGSRIAAGQSSLQETLAQLAQRLPAEEAEAAQTVLASRPLAAAAFIRRRLGAGLPAALADVLDGADAESDRIRLLAALPFRAAVTTTWDDALDRALGPVADGSTRGRYTPYDAAALRADSRPFVLHALGDPRRPETLLWSNEELQAALSDGELRAALHDLYRTRSFLFVGFDTRDLDFQILVERLLTGARTELTHYAILPGLGVIEQDELWASWRIRVLAADDIDQLLLDVHEALAVAPARPADDDGDGWLAVLAADPTDLGAAAHLDRIADELRERGDHDALVELLLGRVGIEPTAARRAEMLLTVARLFEYEADDAERALTALLAAYKEEPAQADWHELLRLAAAANGWDDVIRELAPVAALPAAVRAALHRKAERWADMLAALDELAADGLDDAPMLRREAAALAHEKLDDVAGAIARYEALSADAPHDLELLRTLERLYGAAGRNAELLANLARQAEATPLDAERATLYRRLARAWEVEGDGAAAAVDWWEQLLALSPDAEDALAALERLHRQTRQWPELAAILRRRAAQATGTAQAELYADVAALLEQELADVDGAVGAYQLALGADEQHARSLAELTRIYDETGGWHSTVSLLEKRARLSSDRAEQLAHLFRAGELSAARLDDKAAAERHFQSVLELEPTHVPALTALAAIHRQAGAQLRAAKLLVEAVQHTPNRLERTRLLVEAGSLYQALEQPEPAIDLFQQALAIDPEHDEAGAHLAELLWRAERHAELVPVLEMLTRKPAEAPDQVERLARLAQAAHAVGLEDKVPKAWARAAELDPSHLAAQRGHADHLMATAQWASALRSLERLFQHHVDKLPTADKARLFGDLAACELHLGAKQSAREFLKSALDVDPSYRPALLLQAQLAADEPAQLVEAKRALLVGATVDEQIRLLGEIGDLYRDALGDPDRAVGAWAEALELRPKDHKLLHRCLDAYVEDRAWLQALEMLQRLIACEEVDAVRAKYRQAAAMICRDELDRPDDAVAFLRDALDDDPTLERSVQALEQLLTQQKDPKELARLYRRRLKQLGPDAPDGKNPERLRIWTALGELCVNDLGELEAGRAALEVALAFDRNNLERHKRLADVSVQAHQFDQAILEHQLILRQEKSRILSYRSLKHLYIQTNERDKSIACSYALEFLRKGEADDKRKVAAHKELPFATARRVLGDDGWARIVHPEEDRLLDLLFAIVGPTVVAGQAQPFKAFGLQRKDAVGAADRSFAKALGYVTTTLDVPLPEAHVKPEQREAVVYANCIDGRELVPVFILGGPLVGDKRREPDQVFELARRAAHLRPERLLRLAMPHPQPIGHVIEAAMALAGSGDAGSEGTRLASALEKALPAPQLEQVKAIGLKLREANTRPEEAALAWLRATDLTGNRAGLLLGGDLESCARLVASEGQPAGAAAPTERLLDLVWSSVTEELFAAKRSLGLPL